MGLEVNNAIEHPAISSESGTPKVILYITENSQVCSSLSEINCLLRATSGVQLPEAGLVTLWFDGKRILKSES